VQFSVRRLLGPALLLGLALASVLNPSGLLYRVLVMVNLLLFATAVSCAVYLPSARRPFWVGVSSRFAIGHVAAIRPTLHQQKFAAPVAGRYTDRRLDLPAPLPTGDTR
jgi:hypothetical protein